MSCRQAGMRFAPGWALPLLLLLHVTVGSVKAQGALQGAGRCRRWGGSPVGQTTTCCSRPLPSRCGIITGCKPANVQVALGQVAECQAKQQANASMVHPCALPCSPTLPTCRKSLFSRAASFALPNSVRAVLPQRA